MSNLKFEMSLEEANVILKGLSSLPYAEVVGVINKFKLQGDTQVAENENIIPTSAQKEETPKSENVKPIKTPKAQQLNE